MKKEIVHVVEELQVKLLPKKKKKLKYKILCGFEQHIKQYMYLKSYQIQMKRKLVIFGIKSEEII